MMVWRWHAEICRPFNHRLCLCSSIKELLSRNVSLKHQLGQVQCVPYILAFLHCYFRCCAVSIHSMDVCWEMPFWLSHFPPPRATSQRCWEVPPALHSLVTAHSQRSQARDSGTAPRSGLGVQGVSLETEHKYQDPNNLITSGDIRSWILGAHPCLLCLERSRGWPLGTGWSSKVFRQSC